MNKNDKIEILYEDDNLMIIYKPSGLLSVPYSGNRSHTAQEVIENMMRKNGSYNSKHRPLPVHRLDRDTSGVMMFALNENSQQKIMDSWHQMVTERLYIAVAENPKNPHKYLPKTGLIDEPLAYNAYNIAFVPEKDDSKNNFKTVPARTEYRTIVRGKTHTLFELSLDTGKKNQIRAHLASKDYPLAGDKNYRAATNPFGRLCLHARTLEFVHPFTNKKMKFEIPEPKEWQEFVEKSTSAAFEQKFHVNVKYGESHKKKEHAQSVEGTRKLRRKELAHMNFIEQGKKRR